MNELGAPMRSRRAPSGKRTSAATAKRMRTSEERMAAVLESRGWLSVPPEYADRARVLLLRHINALRDGAE